MSLRDEILRSLELDPSNPIVPPIQSKEIMCLALCFKYFARLQPADTSKPAANTFVLNLKDIYPEVIGASYGEILFKNINLACTSSSQFKNSRIQILVFLENPKGVHWFVIDVLISDQVKLFILDSYNESVQYLNKIAEYFFSNMFDVKPACCYYCSSETQTDLKNCSIFALDAALQLSLIDALYESFGVPHKGVVEIDRYTLHPRLLRCVQNMDHYMGFLEKIDENKSVFINKRRHSFVDIPGFINRTRPKILSGKELVGLDVFLDYVKKKRAEYIGNVWVLLQYLHNDGLIEEIVKEVLTGNNFFLNPKQPRFSPAIESVVKRAIEDREAWPYRWR